MAEVRGRARVHGPADIESCVMERGGWVLPLASERSPAELEVEREHALQAVARQLMVDPQIPAVVMIREPACPDHPPAAAGSEPRYSDEMRVLGKLVTDNRPAEGAKASQDFTKCWNAFAYVVYHWDAEIQDLLLSRSDHLANAYELGRALAEVFWALDPNAPPRIDPEGRADPGPPNNPVSWQWLLGDERRAVITRLLGRLAPYFDPLTAPAVASSVEVWGAVAAETVETWYWWGTRKKNTRHANRWWRAPGAQATLSAQIANWYSLLVGGLDPETLLKPYALLRSWKIFKKVFKVFGLELAVGLIGAGAIAFGILDASASHNPALKTLIAVLGSLGVTSASLQARLKATTQSTVARLRQDLSTDLVAWQITLTPKLPKQRPTPTNPQIRTKWITERAIARRSITAPLPAAAA
ncbi:MAG: hypothetical protein ACLPYW_08755 [Acidimicrobiales bacterium]